MCWSCTTARPTRVSSGRPRELDAGAAGGRRWARAALRAVVKSSIWTSCLVCLFVVMFVSAQSGEMGPAPRRFEFSEGMLK